MLPPTELMDTYFLSSLRGLITYRLREKKYSQSKIANLLGITQASISQYLTREPSFYKGKMQKIGIKDPDTDHFVEMLIEDLLRGRVEAIYTISLIWRTLLSTGVICPRHKEEASILEECDVCMRLYSPSQEDFGKKEVLHELEKAVKMIEYSPYFQYIMPEVSVNIVKGLQDARSESDIAAFPGRIIKIHGRARNTQPAEFNVSRHMSRMLLAIIKINPDVRAAINIKYDDKIKKILSTLKLKYEIISNKDHKPSLEGDVVVSALRIKLTQSKKPLPNVVIDEGGEGLEPITYIFGKNAIIITKEVLEISERYVRQFHLK